jgi:LmbE family N-acetylglucosaminyl deacetylase
MLVISPHLDDAVFSCGALMAAHAGALVVTVFACTPRDPWRLTEWDAACGFSNAGQAMAARRREDDHALALLGARTLRLGFCDDQYEEPPEPAAVAEALARVIADAGGEVLYPIGLFHRDHRLAHEATVAALRTLPPRTSFAYEDVSYRGMTGVLQKRLAELAATGVAATPAARDDGLAHGLTKARAVAAYVSQWRALGSRGRADTARTERLWTLEPEAAA